MIFTARARPKEYQKTGLETSIIAKGVNVRLNHPFEELEFYAEAFNKSKTRVEARKEARKCYARVKQVHRNKVEVVDMTPNMKKQLDELNITDDMLDKDKIQPLCPSRGKAGGMNHALEILDEHLLSNDNEGSPHYPSLRKEGVGTLLFGVFDCRHMGQQGFWEGVVPNFYRYTDEKDKKKNQNYHKAESNAGNSLREPLMQGQEDGADLESNRDSNRGSLPDQQDSFELEIDPKIKFVQLPQTFAGLTLLEDFFDMRNEYGFRMSNTVRSGVGAVTSCGTNAVWKCVLKHEQLVKEKKGKGGNKETQEQSFDKSDIHPYSDNGFHGETKTELSDGHSVKINPHRILSYRFNTQTMIEDTASSHDAILDGEKSVYHFDRKVLGARKGAGDYLAAVFRWSQGGVQLLFTSYFTCPKCCERTPSRVSYCHDILHFHCSEQLSLLCAWSSFLQQWEPVVQGTASEEKKCCDNCCKTFSSLFKRILRAWWPWMFLILFIFPIVFTIIILQQVDVNEEPVQGPLHIQWYFFNQKWCNGFWRLQADNDDNFCSKQNFAILSLFFNEWYAVYFVWMMALVIGAWRSRRFATYIIMLENTTYFFNSISAFFWAFFPIYMSITGTIPLKYDPAALTFGGLWLEFWTWVILYIIKSWSPPGK